MTVGCRRNPAPAPPVAAPVKSAPVAKVEEKKEEKKEPELKGPQKGKGLVFNVRMAAERPKIQTELKAIGEFYVADSATGTAPQTVDALKESLRRDAPGIVKKIDEGVYTVNLKGKKLQPGDILAYETEASSETGFCIVRASGQVETNVPFEQMRKELGQE